MEHLIKDFLAQKSFVVAGSFRDESKYAYRIFQVLKQKGHEVYLVHPSIKEVAGQQCYARIGDIPHEVDVANLVTPPAVTERLVAECKEKGIRRIWLQPGAESEAAIRFCSDNGMDVIYQVCIMVRVS